MEIWKDIPNTNGYYQVSNYGNVRSVDRQITYSNGKVCLFKGRPLKPSENGWGYLQVHFRTADSKYQTITIHRLVALLFVDGYADGLEVNHKDENKHNNFYGNLEWVTRSQNMTYGSTPTNRAENYKRNSYAKKGKTIVVYKDNIKIGEYNGYKEAGDALGVTGTYISFIANGQRKSRHIRVEIKKPRSYQIGQYKDGVLIAVHSSMTKASKAVGLNWHLDRKYIGSGKEINGYYLCEIM